ncbi:MAG TPA: murein L,D-transpeptidase catalytic domain family protein, partial [Segetibacter sp.]
MQEIKKVASKYVLVALLLISANSFANDDKKGDKKGLTGDKNFPSLFSNSANAPVIKKMADSIYDLISLGEFGLEREIFFTAYKGYQYLQNKGALSKTNLLTICDYSQSINNKRLYVIDVLNSRLLFNTFVSHGRNSGNEFATSFSNHDNSNKSSLGFLVTADAYNGKAGLSLRFDGMERGINDRVRSRAIVL